MATQFFKSPLSAASLKASARFLDVGTEGPWNFRAVAAGIIDKVISGSNPYQELLKQLLPDLSIKQLTHITHNPNLLEALTVVLVQTAVLEMNENIELYPGVDRISQNALKAVANRLQIPVRLKTGRGIFVNHYYGPVQTKFDPVALEQNRNCYFPQLINTAYFETLPRINHSLVPVEAADLLTRIQELDKSLCKIYETNLHRLTMMVNVDNKISHTILINLYLENINKSITNPNRQGSLEYGYQHLFEQIMENTDQEFSDEQILLQAISREITCGQLDWDTVEQTQNITPGFE